MPWTGITVDEDVGIVELCVNYSEADNLPLNVSATIHGGMYLITYKKLCVSTLHFHLKIKDYFLSKQCYQRHAKLETHYDVLSICLDFILRLQLDFMHVSFVFVTAN